MAVLTQSEVNALNTWFLSRLGIAGIGGRLSGLDTDGSLVADVVGSVTGDVKNADGTVVLDVGDDETAAVLTGTFEGDIKNADGTVVLDVGDDETAADLTGDVTGDVTGGLTGNVFGNVTGNVTGNLLGTVTPPE